MCRSRPTWSDRDAIEIEIGVEQFDSVGARNRDRDIGRSDGVADDLEWAARGIVGIAQPPDDLRACRIGARRQLNCDLVFAAIQRVWASTAFWIVLNAPAAVFVRPVLVSEPSVRT